MAALVCLRALGEDCAAANHTLQWSSVSQSTVDSDFIPLITSGSASSTASSPLVHNSTASLPHKRLKLSPPTDTPTANHTTADVSVGSAVEIVRQDLNETSDADTHVS